MNVLAAAAVKYAASGWATHPLRNNEDGYPKVAIVKDWQHLTPEDIEGLPWDRAAGIGIIGGSNSQNLGFIDIDQAQLAADVAAYLVRRKRCLMAWTARRRIHVYVQECEPSSYRKIVFPYKGEDATVELRAQGSYVAAPPSPGYLWLNESWEPLYGSLLDVWQEIVLGADLRPAGRPGVLSTHSGSVVTTSAGYPTGWAAQVPFGERNQACFYEAACLKDARMPIEQAWAFMQGRISNCYAQPIHWPEMRRTFESAFSRPVRERPGSNEPGIVGHWPR